MICVSLKTLMFPMNHLPQEECLIEFGSVMVKLYIEPEGTIDNFQRLGDYSPFGGQITLFPCRDYEHRGGLWGTFVHEFCHALQYQLGSWHGIEGNAELYDKWSAFFHGTYAGKNPAEAEAEVFRWLWMSYKGYSPAETWERNWTLVSEYEKYFRKKGWGGYLPPAAF